MSDVSDERLAIVTGTSAGLGEAVARQLLARNWSVVGIARRPSPISHAAYHHLACDLATVSVDETELSWQLSLHQKNVGGRRVGLVNNAASPEGLVPLDHLDPRLVARIFAVNVVAPVWLMGHVLRTSSPNAVVRIVNVSTGAATSGFPGLAAYGSSKAALRLAGMSLAREWDPSTSASARRNAAILSYEPGIVDTDMQRYARSRAPEEFPWVQIFKDFEARGLAVPAELPARDIVAFLESDDQPPFAERRLKV